MNKIVAPCPHCGCQMAGDHTCHSEVDCPSPPHMEVEIKNRIEIVAYVNGKRYMKGMTLDEKGLPEHPRSFKLMVLATWRTLMYEFGADIDPQGYIIPHDKEAAAEQYRKAKENEK